MNDKKVSVDLIAPNSHLVSLDNRHDLGSLDVEFDDYKLSMLLDDVLLVEYVDANDTGEIERGGIVLPANMTRSAWRKAKVILAGPNAKYVKVGDIVMFGNDKGINIGNIEVDGYGQVEAGRFINEDRLFGVCKPKTNETSNQ